MNIKRNVHFHITNDEDKKDKTIADDIQFKLPQKRFFICSIITVRKKRQLLEEEEEMLMNLKILFLWQRDTQ